MKSKGKLYLKIYVAEAKTLEEAIGKKGKLAHIICTSEKESQTFVEAIGIELTRKEWSDEEPDIPEMGFRKRSA